jgi:HlyD family secretion protein
VATVEASEAAEKTSIAELERSRADFRRVTLDYERSQGLHAERLISQQQFETSKAAFETAKASIALSEARVTQAAADLNRARSNLIQARANEKRVADDLQKTIYTSPLNGIVTDLPVEVGEQMVTGVQNTPGSFLMTVADTSKFTAEVKVDETDIVRLELGQVAEVTIDAFPDEKFAGHITEIGTTAIIRSTGQSTAQLQTGTQEAKDFKVVVTLDDPPAGIRPGLSSTARITTATRADALAIPIQALTIRRQSDIDAAERRAAGEEVAEAAGLTASGPGNKDEVQGVFVIEDGEARFRPVETGITGVTNIEVVSGLEAGEQIVTGSYSVLRELKHLANVKVEKAGERKK